MTPRLACPRKCAVQSHVVWTEHITTDEQHGKRLLIPSAYYLNAAYRMYGLPARVYTDQEQWWWQW
jgi:hypothetical protein